MSCIRALLSTHDLRPAATLHSQQPLSITSTEKPTVGKDFWLAKTTNLNLQEHSAKPGHQMPISVSASFLHSLPGVRGGKPQPQPWGTE